MQPESPLFGKHNTDKIATEVLNEAEEQELSMRTSQALEHPDAIERSQVDTLAQEKNFLECLDLDLGINRWETIRNHRESRIDPTVKAKLFQPHDKAESEQHPGVEFATSVVGFDLKHIYKDADDEVTGQLLLFKLDHGDADMTAEDLKLGTNCRFGAFIREGNVQPFAIETALGRRDGGPKRMHLYNLDPEQDTEEHTAVRDEIRMFLQQRQQET
jgi:hypothetical protein